MRQPNPTTEDLKRQARQHQQEWEALHQRTELLIDQLKRMKAKAKARVKK